MMNNYLPSIVQIIAEINHNKRNKQFVPHRETPYCIAVPALLTIPDPGHMIDLITGLARITALFIQIMVKNEITEV